ncbi:MAG: hypothetical protein HOF15_10560 [Planctomycetaceae bacterium]|nr:hypothetical protein [Planctomycetaceae bacterium]
MPHQAAIRTGRCRKVETGPWHFIRIAQVSNDSLRCLYVIYTSQACFYIASVLLDWPIGIGNDREDVVVVAIIFRIAYITFAY